MCKTREPIHNINPYQRTPMVGPTEVLRFVSLLQCLAYAPLSLVQCLLRISTSATSVSTAHLICSHADSSDHMERAEEGLTVRATSDSNSNRRKTPCCKL